jgi:hypothetical protein
MTSFDEIIDAVEDQDLKELLHDSIQRTEALKRYIQLIVKLEVMRQIKAMGDEK